MIEKQALNKYEQYLYNLPKDRKFSNPTVQRAYDNLQLAKTQRNVAKGIAEFSTDTSGVSDTAIKQELLEAADNVRKNRGILWASKTGKVRVISPLANTGDTLHKGRLNDATKLFKEFVNKEILVKKKLNAASQPENEKVFQSIRNYIKNKPVKAGLIGAGIGAGLGVVGYGIKKTIENT